MFLGLDSSIVLYVVTAVTLASFFLANAMDGVLGRDGFGVIGNQIIILLGFYLGMWAAHRYGYYIKDAKIAVVAGLSGSFTVLFSLCVIKAVLNRL